MLTNFANIVSSPGFFQLLVFFHRVRAFWLLRYHVFGTVCTNCRSSAHYTQNITLSDFFKNKLYKFWSNQTLIYDYKAELTGIGNRSFINNLDR